MREFDKVVYRDNLFADQQKGGDEFELYHNQEISRFRGEAEPKDGSCWRRP